MLGFWVHTDGSTALLAEGLGERKDLVKGGDGVQVVVVFAACVQGLAGAQMSVVLGMLDKWQGQVAEAG